MLYKTLNHENILMIMFIILLILVSICFSIDKCLIDIIYLVIIGYYFCRFLVIKYRR